MIISQCYLFGMMMYQIVRDYIVEHRIKVIVGCVCIAAVLVFGITRFSSKKEEDVVKVVEVVVAAKETIEKSIRLIGIVRPKQSTQLIAKANGVFDIIKPAGFVAKKDTLIAKIINYDLEKNYSYAESAEKIASEQYKRMQTLSKSGAVSVQSLDEKKAAWLEAEKNRAMAKIMLDKNCFYAPFDGVIGSYKVRSGTEVKEGVSLITFYAPEMLVVEFDIPGIHLPSINVGQNVVIAGKAYALQHVQKMIAEDTHMSPAMVEISTKDHVIGMPLNVDLTISRKEGVIVLPIDTLFLEAEKPHVYIVNKESKTILTPVEIGMQSKDTIEITKGINVGDKVVAYGQARLSDDNVVKIANKTSDSGKLIDARENITQTDKKTDAKAVRKMDEDQNKGVLQSSNEKLSKS